MNLILIKPEDLTDDNTAVIKGPRFDHIKKFLSPAVDKNFSVGLLNSNTGTGVVKKLSEHEITLSLNLTSTPPKAMDITLVLCMTRPKMFKRILRTTSMLGVKSIHIINSFHVDKSYFQTELLQNNNHLKYFTQGLEQAKDTVMPSLSIHKRFKPFAEDQLPSIIKDKIALLAHPYHNSAYKKPNTNNSKVLAIGPERGFTDYEVNIFKDIGFSSYNFSDRILRTEDFITLALGRLL